MALFGGLMGNILSGAMVGIYILFGTFALAIVAFLIYRNTGYPFKIIIWEKIGGTFRLAKEDRGKVIKHESGAMIFKGKSKFNNISFKSFQYKFAHTTHKGGYVLEVIKTEKGNFEILHRKTFDDELKQFKFEKPQHDLAYWNNLVKREARAKYSNKDWKQYLPHIISFVGIMLVLMMQMISWHYFVQSNDQVMASNAAQAERILNPQNIARAPPPAELNKPSTNTNTPQEIQSIPFISQLQGNPG